MVDRQFGETPSQEQFARTFQDALQKATDNQTFHYDPDGFSLESEQGALVNLANMYRQYCAADESDRPAVLSQLVRACFAHRKELPEEFAHATPDLRPRLWSRATIEHMDLHADLNGVARPGMPFVSVGGHLALTVVYDLPESVRSLSLDEFDGWGVSFYQALEAARRNLAEDEFVFAGIGESLYASHSGDSYDASRIVLLDLIRSLDVRGDTIAMVPNRDLLLITGSDDEQGLGMMLEFAEQGLQQQYPLVASPLRLVGDGWVDWLPGPEHPHASQFRRLRSQWLGGQYHDQKEQLDELFEKTEQDIFVASFSGIKKGDEVFSYCIWPDGVDHALLPTTDLVFLMRDPEAEPTVARWDDLRHIVGDLLEETDYYPDRFRIRSFPSEEQLAKFAGLEGDL